MEALVEELEDNRVRLTVDVPQAQMEHAFEHAASDLAETVKIPGFRKGKVPMPVLLARVGKERLHSEAVESHIGSWFMSAAARSRIRPVEQPQYEYELPETPDTDWRFTATVSVQPKPVPADWTQIEVGTPDAEVPDDLIEHELNVLRSSVAELAPVEDRPAQPGDTVVVDLEVEGQEAQRDYVVELGAGRLVPELEQALIGMSPGETREAEFQRSEDATAAVQLTLKEIKEKVLPPLDDDLARAASEFETLDELRSEIEARLREQIEAEIEGAVRGAAVDELVKATGIEASGPLVDARARTLLNNLARSLAARGISLDTYISLSGTSPEELDGADPRRGGAVRRPRARARSRRRQAGHRRLRRGGRGPDPRGSGRGRRRRGRADPAATRCRNVRGSPRGHPSSRGARPRGLRGQTDSRRAGRGARGDLDTREGKGRDTDKVVDPW